MKTPLQNQFEIQLKALTGFEFQKVVIRIFQLKYGTTGFTDIRLQKDKGNDGIIESEKRVIACFAPDVTLNTQKRQKEFEKKAKSDFESYQTNWQTSYSNWSIVINQSIDPKYDMVVKGLTPTGSVIGLTQLIDAIGYLKGHEKRQLGEELRIPKELFSQDYLHELLKDLLKESETSSREINYDKKSYVYIEQKIKLNYDESDIETAINEYGHLLERGYLEQVKNIMSGYEDVDIDRLKNRVIDDYKNHTNGDFKTKLKQLSEHYLVKYSPDDDDYLLCIKAVLIYLFEQCLIGRKET